ncbi:MAG: PorP/SprF family type IX secretion system membrane protein [Chitinophagales bacterium]|nr:PorP/SprF family type IX secretion system membrane protein [Chitinophagales bacterium]
MKRNQSFRFALLLGGLCIALSARAQQLPYGTFYRNNWQLVNPAAIDRLLMSSKEYHPTLQFTANFRPQWIGTEGAPLTGFFQFEQAPDEQVYERWPVRWGGQGFFDKTDILTTYGFYGNFSREFTFDNTGGKKLRVGITPGLLLRQYDVGRMRARDGIPNDPVLLSITNDPTRLQFDFSAGMFYHKTDANGGTNYFGFSLPSALGAQFNPREDVNDYGFKFKMRNFYFVWGKYISNWSDDDGSDLNIEWEPTIWVRGVGQGAYSTINPNWRLPVSVDANLRVYFKPTQYTPPKFWIGAGYGTNRQLSAETGFNITAMDRDAIRQNLQIGLAYNVPTTRSLFQLGQSFEINFSWCWD